MLPACPGGWDDLFPGRGWKWTVSQSLKGLERRTRYYWWVTAGGPSSHNVSQVWSFTSGG